MSKFLYLFLVLKFSSICWAQDIKLDFLLKEYPTNSQSLSRSLVEYKLAFVPGFLENWYDSLDFVTVPILGWGNYFKNYRRYFQSNHIDAEMVQMESENGIKKNSIFLKQYIQKQKKKIIFVTHSKGSLELLQALVRWPELQVQVRAWIAIQPPFWGSPLTQKVLDFPLASSISQKLLEGSGGELEAARDLLVSKRSSWMQKNRAQIEGLIANLPVLILATCKKTHWSYLDTPLSASRFLVGGCNDGLVPLWSQSLLNVDRVLSEDLDHFDLAYDTFGYSVPRNQILSSSLKYILSKTFDR